MLALALRLLALLALLQMPLGMTAQAEAHPVMAMARCPDQAPAHHPKSMASECMMACAATVPAVEQAGDEPPSTSGMILISMSEHPLHGLHPETATPPPRLS